MAPGSTGALRETYEVKLATSAGCVQLHGDSECPDPAR
jgi:hypothetical protein